MSADRAGTPALPEDSRADLLSQGSDAPALAGDRHPLGYRKVNLLRLFGFRLRLHVWSGEGSEAPHDHRWWFVSVPLCGRFVETRWREVTDEEVAVDVAFPASAGRRYEPSRRAAVEAGVSRLRRPLMPYLCRRGVVHSFRTVGCGRHVTLVLLGRAKSETSNVWERSQ